MVEPCPLPEKRTKLRGSLPGGSRTFRPGFRVFS